MKLSQFANRLRRRKVEKNEEAPFETAFRQTPVAGFDLLSLAVRSMR